MAVVILLFCASSAILAVVFASSSSKILSIESIKLNIFVFNELLIFNWENNPSKLLISEIEKSLNIPTIPLDFLVKFHNNASTWCVAIWLFGSFVISKFSPFNNLFR